MFSVRATAIAVGMARLWREGTTGVLALYLALVAFGSILAHAGTSSGRSWGARYGFWFAVTAFLIWRVRRGGYLSWVVLWLVNGVITVLGGLFAVVNSSGGSAVVFVLGVICLLLLLSPAARSRL